MRVIPRHILTVRCFENKTNGHDFPIIAIFPLVVIDHAPSLRCQRKSLNLRVSPPPPIANSTSKPDRSHALEKIETAVDESATSKEIVTEPVEEHVVTQTIFCFGIPYGGLVMYEGLLGFAFSRNPSSLSTGVLYGGGLLALSTLSMKIWRQGKSSFPYILDQAVLSAVVFWKNFTAYSMTKKLFSAGLFSVVSAAMLCFYSYVVLSGGNPPPKKLKPSASPSY
ncbi:hypothetical protein DY000_02032413 [Brassica cretica]|uniref:Protein FATTY ACID EXPORT 1, chloroplastic n=1 Tax=Brassica cretica TaxID=69181 RepID=A0ABQ7DUA2_BRACR|nr:hypothetical protein DY000_02032413 [Brassica cretica]